MQSDDQGRVLVFAPIGRDGPVTAEFLRNAGVRATVCSNLAEVVAGIRDRAAVVLLAEEGLFGRDLSGLMAAVSAQPPWSDLPFVLLTSRQEQRPVSTWRIQLLNRLGNVFLLERPVQSISLISALRAALRARARQYEIKALLEAQERAAAELEAVIEVRTAEVAKANDELRIEVAERARIEDALRQTQRIEAIGQLTGGIAHDFNNLLMVISGGLDRIERDEDPEHRRRLLSGMKQAAQRGASLTRQLLAFSRRQELKPEPIDLADQIAGMRELLDRSLRGDVQVSLAAAADVWPVEADPSQLELAILNLAVNARDAMPHGGSIEIRVENVPGSEDGADCVRLAVSDGGTGMSEETKTRAFEPFFTTKDVGRGSGLGLAQVHGFAKQSGGSVHIDSGLGVGTTISLLLPRSNKTPGMRPVAPALLSPEVNVPPSSGSVLLVEDDDEVAALVSEMLQQLGYAVTRAATAAAALGALSNGRSIDVVVSDIMMPGGMNGVELAHELRQRRGKLPILLISGYPEAARGGERREDIRILAKPFRIDELASALSDARAAGAPSP